MPLSTPELPPAHEPSSASNPPAPNAELSATIADALVMAGLVGETDKAICLGLLTSSSATGMGWRELLERQLVPVAATAPLATS